jgi:phosphoribosylformylglycinamidine cyclo-ligase
MLNYRAAGVDIDATGAVKRRIARMARRTYSPNVLSEIGLFGSLFQLKGYREPVLVASCDGVGTKLTVARVMDRHDTVGEDIVNHSVNDILTLGATPLFFLDYIAYSQLKPHVLPAVIRGLVRGCRSNGCALIGGETAMMPGLYRPGDYDLVGTIIGVVEKSEVINARRIRSGDILLGLASTGLHTNGYSLARKALFERMRLKPNSLLPGTGTPVGRALLRVHRSYLPTLRPYLRHVKALAHITGGGFRENIERLLPCNVDCRVYREAWSVPALFRIIQQAGRVPEPEMYRVFNMGIGMVVIADPDEAEMMFTSIPGARIIGEVVKGQGRVRIE